MEHNRKAIDHQNLRQVHPWRFWAKLALLVALMLASSSGVLLSAGMIKLTFQLILGVLFANAVELVHQCIHQTATGRREMDQILGRMLGWPAGVSFWHYLYFHLWHHRHNGTAEDLESFGYAYELLQSPKRLTRLVGLVWHLSQVSHYVTLLHRLGLAVTGCLPGLLRTATPKMPEKVARLIQRDYQIIAALACIAVLASLVVQTTILIDIWVLPLLFGYGPAHALIELPEHFLCDRPSTDVFANTRHIAGSWFSRWLTNANNHHVGHHYDQTLPMANLAEFEAILLSKHEFKHKEKSYPRFYAHVFRFLWNGPGM